MKKTIILSIALFAIILSGFTQEIKQVKIDKKAPEITFEKNLHDFGTIPYRGDGTYEFKFKNTGKNPLTVSRVKTSCGCTTPEWSKEPVLKKKSGIIKVKYATNRIGSFTKTITVYSNAKNGAIVLTIKGKVLSAKKPIEQSPKKK